MEPRTSEVVGTALDLEGAAREAYLTSACATDAELLARVRAELARLEGVDDSFLVPPDPVLVKPPELPDFELLDELGRGGSGIVYRAWQKSLGREVAVKLLSYELASEKSGVERFHREARLMAQIEHSAIAQVFTSGSHDGHHYIAMELVRGHDLETELELHRHKARGQVTFLPSSTSNDYPGTCARLVATIADGLDQAHKQKIVHRDVKPRNLLLQPDGHVKLVDFGLARDDSVSRMTRSNVIAGTLYYLSPEQAQAGRVAVDHRTDVYSLGVVLYELLTLTRPFDGPTPVAVLRAIESHDPKPARSINSAVGDELSKICAIAMHRDVERRYRSAGALAAELRRVIGGRPIRAKGDSRGDWLWTRLVRHRRAIVPAVIVAAVLLAAFGCLTYIWHQTEVGHLDLRISAQGYARARIAVRRKDPRTDALGDRMDYGEGAALEAGLEPGYYRLYVSCSGKATLELARYLERGAITKVEIREVADIQTPTIAFPPDSVTIENPGQQSCGLTGLTVSVPSFEIDAHEVTNRSFRDFCDRTGRPEPQLLKTIARGSADELRPVTMVSFRDAQAYAEWRGRRLPTLGEWLVAARDKGKHRAREGTPITIGDHEEWTESLSCIKEQDAGSETWKDDQNRRLVVGGHRATPDNPEGVLSVSKQGTEAHDATLTRGFRCARSIP